MTTGRPFRLGYNTNSWGRTPDLDVMLGDIAGAGWEGVEFITLSLDWLGTPRHLSGLLDKHGLTASAMFGRLDTLGDDAEQMLERERRRIEYAAELGCRAYPFTGPPRVVRRPPTEDEFKRLGELAETLIDHAAGLGQILAFHAHPNCVVETEAEQDRLLSYTDRLQVCVDVSIAALMREDAVAQLRKYRDRLGYVHMKDVAPGKYCIMGRGMGLLDFALIRETLLDIGYTGWVVGELGSGADTGTVESCYANREYLRSLGY